MARIAFIGTGTMGREMVLKLLQAGHEVTVFNRTAARAASLVAAGAGEAKSAAAASKNAEFIISMVGDDESSRQVWLGPDGVLQGDLAENVIAIESATLSRTWVEELAETLAGRAIRFIDCPVTGGPDGAAEGLLTLLVGADAMTLDAARTVLECYGEEIIHFGAPGAGTAYKLIVNLMGAVQAAAVAEALVLAERAGLDAEQVAFALSKGACASPMVEYIGERMVKGNHEDIYFLARWRHKDAAYALEMARRAGVRMPTSEVAAELFQSAVSQGFGDLNSSVVIDVLRKAQES